MVRLLFIEHKMPPIEGFPYSWNLCRLHDPEIHRYFAVRNWRRMVVLAEISPTQMAQARSCPQICTFRPYTCREPEVECFVTAENYNLAMAKGSTRHLVFAKYASFMDVIQYCSAIWIFDIVHQVRTCAHDPAWITLHEPPPKGAARSWSNWRSWRPDVLADDEQIASTSFIRHGWIHCCLSLWDNIYFGDLLRRMGSE